MKGPPVALPGNYSAAQLVLLGYRTPLGSHRDRRAFPVTDM
jgi:hypothetical protein